MAELTTAKRLDQARLRVETGDPALLVVDSDPARPNRHGGRRTVTSLVLTQDALGAAVAAHVPPAPAAGDETAGAALTPEDLAAIDLRDLLVDTAANLAAANPVLAPGRHALASDTGQWKLGDGVTPYAGLPWLRVNQDPVRAASQVQQVGVTAFVDVTALVQFTVGATPWMVHAFHPYIQAAANVVDVMAQIADEGNVGKKQAYLPSLAAGKFTSMTVWERISVPGVYQRKLRVGRFAGTGTVTSLINDPLYEAFIRAYPEK